MAEISPVDTESVYPNSHSDIYPSRLNIRSSPSVPSDSPYPVSNLSLQSKEMKRLFNYLMRRLQEKEDTIMAILESNENTGEFEKIRQLHQLYESKTSLKESMKNPVLDSGLKKAMGNIQDQINKLEKQLNITKYFVWNLSECENAIDNVCMLVEHGNLIHEYKKKRRLRWKSVSNGAERTQVIKPSGMAIHPYTDDIYIGDPGNQRIQTYNSEGKHLSCIRLEKDFQILHLEFFGEFLIFLGTIERTFYLLKINPTNGQTFSGTLSNMEHIKFNEYDEPESNIVFSLNKAILAIQVSIYLPNHLILTQLFSFDTCEPFKSGAVNIVELRSPYIEDDTEAVRLKSTGDSLDETLFHVLYQNSPYALQTFNIRGDLTRSIVNSRIVSPTARLSEFILDKDGNAVICKAKHVTKLNKETDIMELVDIVYSFYVFSDFGGKEHKWRHKSSNCSSIIKALIPKRFQKFPEPTFPILPVEEDFDSHQLFASLNSNQEIVVLNSAEPSFLLRAF